MNYTELAKKAPHCFGCRFVPEPGSLVLAHRNLSGWGLLFGQSVKALSLAGAILCPKCHAYGDGEGRKDSHFWELAVQRTQTWAWSEGFVTFRPDGGEAVEALR